MSGMRSRWNAYWDNIRTSLWLVPGVMLVAGVLLAATMLRLEPSLTGAGDEKPVSWLSSGSGEDAASLLATLLTAVITMASMVFSVTIVALSLAANSYGPRLIRTFRANRSTQITLGIFVMTIVYVLIVLRSVRVEMDVADVPHVSVGLGVVLALGSVLALLAFIQGLSRLMVADEVVRRVQKEFDHAIDTLPRQDRPAHPVQSFLPDGFEENAARIALPREGYVQAVAVDDLLAWAGERGVVVRLDFRPGDFVVEGDRKVLVHPAPADERAVRAQLGNFIVSGQERTPTQDLEFAIRHLVEVAVRALSPGINDPFTAMTAIDRLRGGLCRLAKRSMPPDALHDGSGQLRVVRRTTTFAGALDAALNQIRQAGSQKPSILIHMLDAIEAIAAHVRTAEQRDALARHAELVLNAGQRDIHEAADVQDLWRSFKKAREALSKGQERDERQTYHEAVATGDL